jgi:WD40 repeat protein
MLYEMLTGRPPLTGDSDLELLRKIGADDPPLIRTLRTGVPGDLEAICMKCLERRPEERYQTAAELSLDLRRFLNGEVVEARPVSGIRRLVRTLIRKRIPLKIAGSIGIGLLLAIVWLGFQSYRSTLAQQELKSAVDSTSREAAEHKEVREQLQGVVADTYSGDMRRIMRLWVESSFLLHESPDAAAEIKDVLKRYVPASGTHDPRGFEWYLLSRLCEPDRFKKKLTKYRELASHEGHTYFVKFSADDRYLFSSGADHTVKLWDVRDGRLVHSYRGHSADVNSFGISPDETRIATASDDYSVRVYDVDSSRQLHHFTGHKHFVVGVAFDHSGRFLFSADHLGDCRLWDLQTNAEIKQFQGHANRVQSLHRTSQAGVPDGVTQFVSSAQDGRAHIWNLDFNNLKEVSPVGTLALDGLWEIALGSHRRSEVLAGVGKKLNGLDRATLKFHRMNSDYQLEVETNDFLDTGTFSADERRFLYAGRGCPMGIYDLATRKAWDLPGTDKSLFCWGMTASQNGCYLATAENGGKVTIWNADTSPDYRMLQGVSDAATDLRWSPDGHRLAVGRIWCPYGLQHPEPSMLLHDLSESAAPVDLSQSPKNVVDDSIAAPTVSWSLNHSRFSRDSRSLFVLSYTTGRSDGWCCRIFDLPSGTMVRSFKLPAEFNPTDPEPAQFLLDEERHSIQVLSPDRRTQSRLDRFDIETGKLLDSFVLAGVSFRKPAASHEHEVLLIHNQELRIFDCRTGKLLQSVTTPAVKELTCVAFSADGSQFAAGESIGGTVFVYDRSTGKQVAVLKSINNGSHESLAFSPDGRRLVGGATGHPNQAEYIDVWSLPTESDAEPRPPVVEIPIPASGYGVTSVRFSPDGRSLAAGIITNRVEQGTLYRTPHRESAVAVWQISGDE